MRISRNILHDLPLAYSIAAYDTPKGKRIVCATQGNGGAISFSALDGSDCETVFTGPGGTMTIVPIDGKDEFLVTHEFYKGFQAKNSRVVHVSRKSDGSYTCSDFISMPYLHRFCLLDSNGRRWIVGATLCDEKASRDDWSKPGRIYAGPMEYPLPCDFLAIQSGITKNHGMYSGPRDNLPVVAIITGMEGAFEVVPPAEKNDAWDVHRLLAGEISEIRVFDLDGDGTDELITVEGFHGDRLNVYKRAGNGYAKIYSYPVAFGHALWCGRIFGRPSILIGYNQANAALVLLTIRNDGGEFSAAVTMLDELHGYPNIDVWDDGNVFRVYAACNSGKIIMYTLEDA